MSVVKDAERIGDHSKDIWDIANSGIDLSGAEDIGLLMRYRDRISRLIGETARVFGEKDLETAHALLQSSDELQDEYDELIEEQLQTDKPAREAVPRALLYRYFKRITAHLMNILTSLVMPIDRLDYYDEAKQTAYRQPGSSDAGRLETIRPARPVLRTNQSKISSTGGSALVLTHVRSRRACPGSRRPRSSARMPWLFTKPSRTATN